MQFRRVLSEFRHLCSRFSSLHRQAVVLPSTSRNCYISKITSSYINRLDIRTYTSDQNSTSLFSKSEEKKEYEENSYLQTHGNSSKQMFLLEKEDMVLEPIPPGAKGEELLYMSISKMSPGHLLYVIQNQHQLLNKTHYALALKRLHRILRRLPAEEIELYLAELQKQQGFEVLCALLALKGQHYEAGVSADMLIFMLRLGLDSHHPAVQVYLQLAKHFINDISLSLLVNVAHEVSKSTSTQQTQDLLAGIESLSQHRSDHIAELSVWELITLLDMFGPSFSEEVIHEIIKRILLDGHEVRWKFSVQLLRALGKIGIRHGKLQDLCFDQILMNIEKLTIEESMKVVEACEELSLYDRDMFNGLQKKAITECFNLDDRVYLCKVLHNFSILGKNIIDDIVRDLDVLPDLILDLEHKQVIDVLLILADASHQMPGLKDTDVINSITEQLECNLDQSSLIKEDLIGILHSLHVLGKKSHTIADAVFSPDYIREVANSSCGEGSTLTQDPVRILHRIASTQSYKIPEQVCNLLRERLVGKTGELYHEQIFNSLSFLFEESNVTKRNEISILTLKSDELILVQGQDSVLFIPLPRSCFHGNTGQLKGHAAWTIGLLQQEGHLVTPVNEAAWEKIANKDRLQYLQRKYSEAKRDQSLMLWGMDVIF